jgi:hypothetical protein
MDGVAPHGEVGDGVEYRTARLGAQAQRGGDHAGHLVGIADRGEVHEPHAVGVLGAVRGGGLDGEAGLAGARRAGDGHQPAGTDQPGQFGLLGRPADERGRLRRQVVRRLRDRTRAREVPRQSRPDELEKPFPAVEATQPVQAEVEQPGAVDQRAGPFGGRRRAQHLAAVRGRRDPGGAVHLGGGVLAAARAGGSGVQAHPDQRAGPGRGPGVAGQRPLRRAARGQGGAGVRERDEHRVAFGEQRGTAGGAQGTPQQPPVFGEQGAVARAQQLRQPGRALDVGEQERHQATRQVKPCRHFITSAPGSRASCCRRPPGCHIAGTAGTDQPKVGPWAMVDGAPGAGGDRGGLRQS